MNKIINVIFNRLCHTMIFGTTYFLIESAYKGHWTNYRMFFLSGMIGLLIGCMNELFTYETDLRLQCIVGMLIALLCECIFGYQWNVIEGLNLWDYTKLPFSAVHGQINLFFAVAWLGLTLVCILLDDCLVYLIHHPDKYPYYRIGSIYIMLERNANNHNRWQIKIKHM